MIRVQVMEFVIFDIWADLAQFKKPFTTMSPQTFGFPTGTSLVGMISAIVGLDKKRYWEHFPENSYVLAVGVKKPVKKVVIPINTLKTTSRKHFSRFEEHKRTTIEFIKDGKFRVYFSWKDSERFQQLKSKLANHETHYTVSLGLAWNLADFRYVDTVNGLEKSGGDWIEFTSVIRKDLIEDVEFEDRKIFANRIPVRMKTDNSREVEQYSEYLFENEGKPIRAKVKRYLHLENGENIVPL
jgi:CRISPR-associated protein Cas5h